MSTFLHYVHCKDALLDSSAPGGERCESLTWLDEIVMQLKLDMSCHLLNVYTKFQIDISRHVEEKSGKRGRTDGRTDGQTDGRTLPRHNASRFSNGRIKMMVTSLEHIHPYQAPVSVKSLTPKSIKPKDYKLEFDMIKYNTMKQNTVEILYWDRESNFQIHKFPHFIGTVFLNRDYCSPPGLPRHI